MQDDSDDESDEDEDARIRQTPYCQVWNGADHAPVAVLLLLPRIFVSVLRGGLKL